MDNIAVDTHNLTVTFLVEKKLDISIIRLVEEEVEEVFGHCRHDEGEGIVFSADIELPNDNIVIDIVRIKHKIHKTVNDALSITTQLRKIVDNECKILVGPTQNIGYSDYADEFFETPLAHYSFGELNLLLEWEAEDHDEAKEIAKTLNEEVSRLLGTTVVFNVYKNIWGVNEDGWYVTVDTAIDFNEITLHI